MNLTPDEELLLVQFAREAHGRRWGFNVVVLTPIALFGAYGLFNRDIAAVAVALLASLVYLLWHMSSESHSARLLQSISQKVLAARTSGTSARTSSPES